MASITKSSGTLFPLISQMKDQNQNQTVVEPKLKRTVGQRQDVRTGDGLTTIMSKVWGLLKKQDDFTKAATKEFSNQVKFRKESKDLMKKNNDVVLKALNALNKDSTKILTKILKAEDKSLKEQEKALEQQKVSNELKNNFAEENKKETESAEDKRHKEIVELLKKMAGEGEGEGKTKKEQKSFIEKLTDFMGGKFKDLLIGALGGIIGKDFAKFLFKELPGALKSAVSSGMELALANPLLTLAAAITAITLEIGRENKKMYTDAKKAAEEGDTEKLKQVSKEIYATGDFEGTGLSESDISSGFAKSAASTGNTKAADTLKKLKEEQTNPNKSSTQQFPTNSFSLPVTKGVVTSLKGTREIHGHTQDHKGIDIAVPVGTPVLAAAGGTIEVGHDRDSGNYVRVKHDNGMTTSYAHLSKIQAKVGQRVEKGTQIGLSGGEGPGSGHSTGAHLHLGMKDEKGQWVDPTKYIPELNNVAKQTTVARNENAPTATIASSEQPNTMDKTATAAPEENQKPKILGDIIKNFATTAQAEFDASKSLFAPESAVTPSGNLKKSQVESTELKNKQANSNKQDKPVTINTFNNTAMSGGSGGGSSNVPLTPRSNDSVLSRVQSGISVVI